MLKYDLVIIFYHIGRNYALISLKKLPIVADGRTTSVQRVETISNMRG